MGKNKPINIENGSKIIERCLPVIKLSMIRYEAIFDFYSEEPPSISVQLKNDSCKHEYEQILRIRRWNFKEKSVSWCIYAAEREKLDDIIVRKVTWNREIDLVYIKNINKDQKLHQEMDWPSIEIKHTFIPESKASNIIKMLNELDLVIQNGILLKQNMNPDWRWKDLELKRLYDWGQVHSTWSTNMKNEKVENKISKLTATLDLEVESEYQKLQAIYLNYSILPEEFKKLLSGVNNTKV